MRDLSVIIVNYNVEAFLAQALESVRRASADLDLEVFVVDNASSDGSVEMVRQRFPEVKLIALEENLGFAKANNIALAQSDARYLMLLNPDCILREDTLTTLIQFLEDNPEVGGVGPKLLNRDGTFQKSCRRGMPTPWASFCKLSGISGLFPRSRFFNRYEMGYLSPDITTEVEVLVGAAFMIRKEVYDQVGGLNEEYFMFGEDVDWSATIREAGWKLYYVPTTEMIHYKGESTRRSDTDREQHFYNAMRFFVAKRYNRNALYRGMIEVGILFNELLSRLRRRLHFWLPGVIDLGLAFGLLLLTYLIHGEFSWRTGFIPMSLLFALAVVVMNTGLGTYRSVSNRALRLAVSVGTAFMFVASLNYFIESIRYSRLSVLIAAALSFVFLMGWRWLITWLSHRKARHRVLVVGVDEDSRALVRRQQELEQPDLTPVGWVTLHGEDLGKQPEGVPVLGMLEGLGALAEEHAVSGLVFSVASMTYEHIFKVIAHHGLRGLEVQVVPQGYARGREVPLVTLYVEGSFLRKLVNPQQTTTKRVP